MLTFIEHLMTVYCFEVDLQNLVLFKILKQRRKADVRVLQCFVV